MNAGVSQRCCIKDGSRPPGFGLQELTPNYPGEALAQQDALLECEHNPHMGVRGAAGIHQAIRIISRLTAEECGRVIELAGQPGE